MAESRLPSCVVTEEKTGALTVAGQWRIFTAFPNILAIVVEPTAYSLQVTVLSSQF